MQQSEVSASAYLPGSGVLELVDESRRAWSDVGPRPVTVQVWYPSNEGEPVDVKLGPPDAPLFVAGRFVAGAALATGRRYPLVLLSHGTGGSALQHAWLGARLAAHGFVVAGVNHHGNNSIEPYLPEGFVLVWERAKDLTVALDQLLAHPEFGPAIDSGRVGAVGYSAGGYTVLAAAGARLDRDLFERLVTSYDAPPEFPDLRQALDVDGLRGKLAEADSCYADRRIRAVMALAPALGEAFTDAGLAAVRLPLSVVAGGADEIIPAERNARRIANAVPNSRLMLLPGVGHYAFLAECTARGREVLPQLCQDPPGVDRRAVHERVAAMAVEWFREQLP